MKIRGRNDDEANERSTLTSSTASLRSSSWYLATWRACTNRAPGSLRTRPPVHHKSQAKQPIYLLEDGPDDPLGAGRRGEGAHVAVVHAAGGAGAAWVDHPDGHLPVPRLLDEPDGGLQRLQEPVGVADLVEDADHGGLVRRGLVHQVQLHVVAAVADGVLAGRVPVQLPQVVRRAVDHQAPGVALEHHLRE